MTHAQIEAVKVIRSTITQLSAAAACAQAEMQHFQKKDRTANGLRPLEALDLLAERLAAPALRALDVIERVELEK